mgnify:CR=1 FL=1
MYYLVGYNHNKNRLGHYRLDYVKDVKILNEDILDKSKTELNGVSVGKYVDSHPYLFGGEPKSVTVKIGSDRLGLVIDAFGRSFKIVDNDGENIIVEVIS